jgi:hypothetical protein
MTTIKYTLGTRTALTTTALDGLVGTTATYVSAGTITLATASKTPLDVLLEVAVTPGTVTGNKQVVVFLKESLDGTNFSTGPESGTTATDEPNLVFLGVVPCNTNSTQQRATFSIAGACGGVLPHSVKVICKNETGAALTTGSVYYQTVDGEAT